MRKLGIAVAAVVVCLSGIALSQASPVPFVNNSTGVGSDAGNFNFLLADAGVFSQIGADGGSINQLAVTTITTNPTVGNLTSNGGVGFALGVDGAGFVGCGFQGLKIGTGSTIGACGEPYFSTTTPVLMDAGAMIGAGILTNVVPGSCALAAGTCNVAMKNTTGNSLCFAAIQGQYARDSGAVSCYAQADAGSATVVCQGAAAEGGTPNVAVLCIN